MPLWVKNSIVVLLSIVIAAWFSGERIRQLDEKYILENIHNEKTRLMTLFSGLLSNAVLVKNEQEMEFIVKKYIASSPEIILIHITDDNSNVLYTLQIKPINFGEAVRKFEQPIIVGGEEFGILSIYFDLAEYYRNVEEHLNYTRKSAATILLAITLILVFLINFVAVNEEKKKNNI
ncbi:MAG: hypothetical protein ACI9XC_002098 [Gammaproteobacteria bacterium]|jgi:hypothetical protein